MNSVTNPQSNRVASVQPLLTVTTSKTPVPTTFFVKLLAKRPAPRRGHESMRHFHWRASSLSRHSPLTEALQQANTLRSARTPSGIPASERVKTSAMPPRNRFLEWSTADLCILQLVRKVSHDSARLSRLFLILGQRPPSGSLVFLSPIPTHLRVVYADPLVH